MIISPIDNSVPALKKENIIELIRSILTQFDNRIKYNVLFKKCNKYNLKVNYQQTY